MKTVRLGFEIPGGAPVDVPLRHMVVTGQTQEAGKTTTLEALIARSGMKAVAFVTKRGEGSFADARTVPPYFREQADWQFVASILEASRGEKMRFERPWIIRASRGARTLADVQRNVQRLLDDPRTKGLSADVYLVLNEYLKAVVPHIERVRWAERVDLAPGVNAMDLGALNVEMQHLVIRSTIDWVLNKEEGAIVVVPEAWKFIPQGRGTPVKLAAEAFIRQAAALKNYLWLDSQDIAGVEKMILKSVPVWILGVQREVNEVKRTLDQMPGAVPRLTPRQVATLKLGEFYACYGERAIKTYVQPAWMSEAEARAIAEGRVDVAQARRPQHTRKESTVTEQEARELRHRNEDLERRVAELEDLLREYAPGSLAGRAVGKQGAKKAESSPPGGREVDAPPSPSPAKPEPVDPLLVGEDLYEAIKRRLVAEAPVLLRVLVAKPEIEVQVAVRTIEADGDTWLGRTARLIADGFFDEPRASSAVFREAKRRGASGVAPRADEACKKLHAMGFLTREENGFLAVPGMKIRISDGRGRK